MDYILRSGIVERNTGPKIFFFAQQNYLESQYQLLIINLCVQQILSLYLRGWYQRLLQLLNFRWMVCFINVFNDMFGHFFLIKTEHTILK